MQEQRGARKIRLFFCGPRDFTSIHRRSCSCEDRGYSAIRRQEELDGLAIIRGTDVELWVKRLRRADVKLNLTTVKAAHASNAEYKKMRDGYAKGAAG